MKTLLVGSISFGILLSALTTTSSAQTSTSVAVLDVAKVFKNHDQFTQRKEDMKNEVATFEQDIMRQKRELVARAQKLQTQFSPGSAEYRRAEKELAQTESDLRLKLQLKRKELIDREAKLYYETYQQILQVVSSLADQHRLNLVLRYDSEEIDPSDRAKVLSGVNRFVILQRQLDLTAAVLKNVNKIR